MKNKIYPRIEISEHSLMYQRGLECTIQFSYIPDFENKQEETEWVAGYRKGKELN